MARQFSTKKCYANRTHKRLHVIAILERMANDADLLVAEEKSVRLAVDRRGQRATNRRLKRRTRARRRHRRHRRRSGSLAPCRRVKMAAGQMRKVGRRRENGARRWQRRRSKKRRIISDGRGRRCCRRRGRRLVVVRAAADGGRRRVDSRKALIHAIARAHVRKLQASLAAAFVDGLDGTRSERLDFVVVLRAAYFAYYIRSFRFIVILSFDRLQLRFAICVYFARFLSALIRVNRVAARESRLQSTSQNFHRFSQLHAAFLRVAAFCSRRMQRETRRRRRRRRCASASTRAD